MTLPLIKTIDYENKLQETTIGFVEKNILRCGCTERPKNMLDNIVVTIEEHDGCLFKRVFHLTCQQYWETKFQKVH